MSVIKFNRNFSELFNWDSDADPTTEQEYQGAVKNWTETEMNIVDTLLWQPETDYTEENIVKTPSLPLHYVLVCTTGGTSGATEPSYDNVQIGDIVTDGTVEWTVMKLAVGDIPVVSDRAKVDASNIGVNAETDNSELWGSAIGGGEIAEDDGKLVTGGTVHAVTSVLASDIADNTDDIATNTENIAQNTGGISANSKRIGNIEKLLQGNLYDYDTDDDTAYTKTVPSGAMPYAGIEQIGGKTLVWNQMMYDPHMTSADNWSIPVQPQTISKTATNNVLRCERITNDTYNFSLISATQPQSAIVGHKYLSIATMNGDISNLRFGVGNAFNGYNMTSTPTKYASFVTATTTGVPYIYVAGQYFTQNQYFEIQNWCVYDLTLMFGSGNEPTTLAEFEALFPAEYYSYSAPTLLSAGVTEVVSKDSNNATLQTYSIPASIQALEGYGLSCPDHYNYIDYETKKFVQEVGSRAYANGDESDSTVVTDMTTTYYPLTTAVETDISQYITDDNLIKVEANGTLTFPNSNGADYCIPVPSDVTYMIDLQEAINNG